MILQINDLTIKATGVNLVIKGNELIITPNPPDIYKLTKETSSKNLFIPSDQYYVDHFTDKSSLKTN